MIKHIVFDFGQVIVRFQELYMTSLYVKDPAEAQLVRDVVFGRLYWDKLDDGSITDEEVKQNACLRLPEHLRQAACDVYDNWYHHLPFVEGIPEVIRQVKADGYSLFLLSNISNCFAEGYQDVPALAELFGLFDGLVFSAPLGMIKPNKDIFRYLLNQYRLNAEECVFIDDNKHNIAAAGELGFCTYLFDGDAAKLSAFLRQL